MIHTPILTICNREYLPGAVALYRSWIQNSREGFSFYVWLDGDKALKAEAEHKMPEAKVKLNPIKRRNFPTSPKWPESVPSMYWRMYGPERFPDAERLIYIDADALILRDLTPLLDIGNSFIGATKDKTMQVSTSGLPPELARQNSFVSSLMTFNVPRWNEADMLQECKDVMQNPKLVFDCAVQGVMQVALLQDWHEYPYHWQAHAGHGTLDACRGESLVLHFMGTNPWDDFPPGVDGQKPHKIRARNIWKTYAE